MLPNSTEDLGFRWILWLKTGRRFGLCEYDNELCFCKRLRNPWLYKRLLADKERRFMQLDKMDHTSFQRFMLFWTIAILRYTPFLPLPALLWRITSNRIWATSLLRSLDLACASDRLVAVAATYTTHNIPKTNIHALSGIRTRDHNNGVAADLRLRPHGPFLVTYLLYILLSGLRNAKNAEICYMIAKWSSVDILKADEG
jgi:hypothetical protein